MYDITKAFVSTVDLNILLQDTDLADVLHVIDVRDNELILMYENGLLKRVLTAGRYAYWKSMIRYDFVRADISKIEIDESIDRSLLQHVVLASFVRTATVDNAEKALLFIDGKFSRVLDAGVYYWWKNSTIINLVKVDMRQLQLEVNGQEILTRDKAALRINAWAQYIVVDIDKAVLKNKEYEKQLYVAVQLALREYVSAFTLDELLDKKETIGVSVLGSLNDAVRSLGVELKKFGIKDIILGGDVKEIMNQVLIAEKKAQANTIMRREETASTRSLLNTAKLMEENAMLWKLKEMEYVEKIAEKINNISVSGNGALIEQLKQIFTSSGKS